MQEGVSHLYPSSLATLLNQLRNVLRTKHYSYETEKAYVYWVNRFVRFHSRRKPEEITALEIQNFLSHLAIQEHLGHNNVKTTMGLHPCVKQRRAGCEKPGGYVMMKAQRTLMPGQPGTKDALKKYGEKLLCVRYRIDPQTSRKYKTVELIEEEIPHERNSNRIPMNKKLHIRIHPKEVHLRRVVKAVGGKWNVERKTWQLSYRDIKNLGLEKRIVQGNN